MDIKNDYENKALREEVEVREAEQAYEDACKEKDQRAKDAKRAEDRS